MLDRVVVHLFLIGQQTFTFAVFIGRDRVSIAIEVKFVLALEVTIWFDLLQLILRD